MSTPFYEMGDRLRRLRRAAGQTQVEFAETLGVSLRAYKGYEGGEREIPTSVILKLCDMSSVTPSWILTGKKDDIDPASMEMLKQTMVHGLDLLRTHSTGAPSDNWAEFLAVLVSMSHAQGSRVSKEVANNIFNLKDKL
ncbi:helix-turn-helix domain-containing protein [Xanthobacter sp. TB0139]|uniref:helix-turn-helix domain-containing protein n=1 Tax=Xanthobacter sp. TB0139 TaxID=3459178 RepID=UPI004039C175